MILRNNSNISGLFSGAINLYVSACAAEIPDLPEILENSGMQDGLITGIFSPMVNHRSYTAAAKNLRTRTFLLTRSLKHDLALGLVDFCPWRYSAIDRWLSSPGRFDMAAVMLSPPDQNGLCSAGVQADFFPNFHDHVDRIIGFINPNMPVTAGHRGIPYRSLAAAIDYDVPLLEADSRPGDDVTVQIARLVASLVPDGATIQLGVGQLPSEVLVQLSNHRALKVHTGLIDENILKLEEAGALATSSPIVTGTAIGTRRLYDALGDRARFALKPVAFTHAYANIANTDRFTAINSVLQVDLMGQVSGEAVGGRIAASPGGLPDFVRGAQDSPGGRSIIVVKARGTAGKANGIVASINDPSVITNGGVDAHIFVTEFGIADVRGLSIDKRAEAIIAIAAPELRDGLEESWRQLRRAFFGQRPSQGEPGRTGVQEQVVSVDNSQAHRRA